MSEQWDVVIVGGGAAGLSAALTLGRARRRVLVVDGGEPRNRFAAHMHGFLGHEGIDPADLLRRGREEVAAYDVTITTGWARAVRDDGTTLAVGLADGTEHAARALVVATGLRDDLPDVPGLAPRWGRDVLHCPYCHGWEVRDLRLGVLATSPLSTHQAELVRQWSGQLTYLTAAAGELPAETAARLRARGVDLVDSPVTEVLAEDDRLSGVRLADGRTVALDALFTAPTARPNDDFLADLSLDRVENPMGSFLATDPTGLTSHPRIWAVGNVVNPGANVPISVGAGSLAGGVVNMMLVTQDADRAVAADHWEERYAGSDRLWSGRVNPTTAAVVSGLPAGDVLDLGCGEGGDAVWLAERGWRVTAVDISTSALARGAEGAAERGVGDRVTWVAHDLSTWRTEETFDLVTASFFHSTVALERTEILRRAAGRIRPGGHLLVVSHVFESPEDVPPWARRDGGDHTHHDVLLTPSQEVAALDVDPARWEVVLTEVRQREAVGPDGQQTALLKDGVVLLRRRSPRG